MKSKMVNPTSISSTPTPVPVSVPAGASTFTFVITPTVASTPAITPTIEPALNSVTTPSVTTPAVTTLGRANMVFDNVFIKNGLEIVLGIVIIITSHFVAQRVKNFMKSYNVKTEQKHLSMALLSDVVYFCIIILTAVIVLYIYGVQMTGVIAILSAVIFTIGFSLQGTLSDFAAGIILSFFNIYNIGDTIQVTDVVGEVVDFTLINTIIQDRETKMTIIIPNSKIQQSILTNVSKAKGAIINIDIDLSNQNTNYETIANIIMEELMNKKKYSYILYDSVKPVPVKVGVFDMSYPGTSIRVQIFVGSEKLIEKKMDASTKLRQFIAEHDIKMLNDPLVAK